MADKVTILRIEVQGFGEAKQDLEFLTTESDKLTQAKRQLNQQSTLAAKSINAEAGSIAKLRADTALLRQQANNMRAVTVEEIANRDKLIKKINENTIAIRNHDRAMSGSTTLVGEYERGFSGAFQKIGKSVAGAGAIIAGMYGVIREMGNIIQSTNASADEFSFTIEGLKQGVEFLRRAIATTDFSNLVKGFRDAVNEGQRYAQGLDDVDDKTRALRITEARLANEVLAQRQIQNDALASVEAKIAAGERAIAIEEELAAVRTGIADQAYRNELDNIRQITGLTATQIELYVERDEAFMQGLANGERYLELGVQIAKASGEEKEALRAERKELGANAYEYAQLAVIIKNKLPNDEKLNKLAEASVNLEQAKGSALQNTMRIASKLSNAQKEQNKEQTIHVEKLEQEGDELETLIDEIVALAEARNKEAAAKVEADKKKEESGKNQITSDIVAYAQAQDEKRNAEIKAEEKQKDTRLAIAQATVQGLQMASDTIFQNKKNAHDAAMQAELNNENLTAEQRTAIRKKYAKEQQKIDTRQALINTALAIGSALATTKPFIPAALIAAGLAAVQGGLQVAAIKAQKFASGGRIAGGARIRPDSRGDDTLIIAKQGEVILNQRQQLALGARSLKRAGVPGFADGGIVGGIAPSAGYGGDMTAFVDRLIAGINDKQVQLVLPELNESQRRLKMITQSGRL